MAVIVSESQNEQSDFSEKGLDILPHRKRIKSEDLETKFKKPDDPLRLVFVCAMWITGFDVPVCQHDISGQAHEKPYSDADYRPRKQSLPGEKQRAYSGLRGDFQKSPKSFGYLRNSFRRRNK